MRNANSHQKGFNVEIKVAGNKLNNRFKGVIFSNSA